MYLVAFAELLTQKLVTEPAFVHSMPESVQTGVLLLPDISIKGMAVDQDIPGYRYGNFLVAVRAIDFDTAYHLVARAVDALRKMSNSQVGNFFVKQCYLLSEPKPYPRTDGDNVEFSAEMRVYFINPEIV